MKIQFFYSTHLTTFQPKRLTHMKTDLTAWQKSVVNSLNGNDYR
jgi:hypothetical protein|tara:strand:- start:99 stop:230 length:132 start_codon:yes stop_codon:yes gene_type:complete